jgi:hypothetical protein
MEAHVKEARNIPMSQDAALVLALAGTAMPFAHSAEDEAERWLRALRLHGQVGVALQALGVGEAPLMTGSEPSGESPAGTAPFGSQVMDRVAGRAGYLAAMREADAIGTADLLFAIGEVYGRLFDRALYLRGTSREEVLDRLVASDHPAGTGSS